MTRRLLLRLHSAEARAETRENSESKSRMISTVLKFERDASNGMETELGCKVLTKTHVKASMG